MLAWSLVVFLYFAGAWISWDSNQAYSNKDWVILVDIFLWPIGVVGCALIRPIIMRFKFRGKK